MCMTLIKCVVIVKRIDQNTLKRPASEILMFNYVKPLSAMLYGIKTHHQSLTKHWMTTMKEMKRGFSQSTQQQNVYWGTHFTELKSM